MTGEDENEEYDIVGRTEADPLNGKISDESPVGHALLARLWRQGRSAAAHRPHRGVHRAEHYPRCRLSRPNE